MARTSVVNLENPNMRKAWSPRAATILAAASLYSAGCSSASAPVTTGLLSVSASGLPNGLSGIASVNDSAGLSDTATVPHTFNLPPGVYIVSAVSVSQGGTAFSAAASPQSVVVRASLTPVIANFTYTRLQTLTITPAALPSGTAGVAYGGLHHEEGYCGGSTRGHPCEVSVYYYQLAATGGAAPYNWSGFSMPAALYVIAAGATGQISGTPTTPGTYTLKVTVTDSATPPDSATITYLIEVAP
jgi:hypothetical protein